MSTAGVEHFLARLYTDATLRDRFLADPAATMSAEDAPLTPGERDALVLIDRDGLQLAARSFAAKRERRRDAPKRRWWDIARFGGARD
jgi:hypothetical protein